MRGISAELVERAIRKLQDGKTAVNVAAIFVGEVSPQDLDGVRWRFVVTDGDKVDTVDAGIPGSQGGAPGMAVGDETALERQVERKAAGFPVATRLTDLVAASPLVL